MIRFSEVIVFVIGGGCYAEYGNLQVDLMAVSIIFDGVLLCGKFGVLIVCSLFIVEFCLLDLFIC